MALILSLEFTDSECKVVLADQGKGGRLNVKSLSSFDLPRPEDPAAKISERANALKDHLKTQRITAKSCVVVIPKNFVMARSVSLPSTVDDEIAGMARFEAERHIPFNAERHIISYHVLGKQAMQGSDVLLAAVDLPIAQEYLDICVKAGLSVAAITVSSIAMFNSFAVAERTALDDRTVMVLNIGRGATDLVIATNGNITFMRGSTTGVSRLVSDLTVAADRSITISDLQKMDALEPQLAFAPAPQPVVTPGVYDELPTQPEGEADAGFAIIGTGNDDPPPPPPSASRENPAATVLADWLSKLLQEIKRTFEFASREFNCPMIDHIYLTGEGATIKNISQYFQANFNVDAAVFDPLHRAEVSGKARKLDVPPQLYTVALGGAIGRQPYTVHINLLPGSYTEAISAKRQQRSYIITGILALLALGAGYFYLSDVFATNNKLLAELNELNNKDKARVSELSVKKERLRIIRENVQDDKGALAVLRFLSEKDYFPESIALSSFDYKRGDYVKLTGDAKDLPSANQLITDLRNTGMFSEAKLDNTEPNKTLRGRPPIPVLGWSATFTFPKPVKAKAKSSKSSEKSTEDELNGIK